MIYLLDSVIDFLFDCNFFYNLKKKLEKDSVPTDLVCITLWSN